MKDRNAPPRSFVWLAGFRDVSSLRSLGTVDDLELDRLAFFERPEAGALNRREVNEDVVTSFALDETVTFRVVEPLDLTRDAHRACLTRTRRRATALPPVVVLLASATG